VIGAHVGGVPVEEILPAVAGTGTGLLVARAWIMLRVRRGREPETSSDTSLARNAPATPERQSTRVPKTSKTSARTAIAGAHPARIVESDHAYQRMRGIGSGWRRACRGWGRRRLVVKRSLSMFAS
jgi:hypothetical protein